MRGATPHTDCPHMVPATDIDAEPRNLMRDDVGHDRLRPAKASRAFNVIDGYGFPCLAVIGHGKP